VDGEDGLAAVANAMEEPRTDAATATTQHPNMVEDAVLEATVNGDVATLNHVEDGVDGAVGQAAVLNAMVEFSSAIEAVGKECYPALENINSRDNATLKNAQVPRPQEVVKLAQISGIVATQSPGVE